MQLVQQPTWPLLSCEGVMSKSYMFAVFKMAGYTFALGSGKWVLLFWILSKASHLGCHVEGEGHQCALFEQQRKWFGRRLWHEKALACLIFGLLKGTLKSYKRKAYQPGFQCRATLGPNWALCLLIWWFDFHFMYISCCFIGKGFVQLICVNFCPFIIYLSFHTHCDQRCKCS